MQKPHYPDKRFMIEILSNWMNIYSEVSIIEKLPLEKNHTYLIIFLRNGQVQNNFYCTIILTYDLRFNT